MEDVQDTTFKWTNTHHQYLATIIANLISLTQGCMLGWSSPAFPQLLSIDTPLTSGPLTNNQMSWIGSINAVGGIMGNMLSCYMISLLGAKRAALSLAIPSAAFLLLIYFGETSVHVLVARLFGGIAGGGVDCTVCLFVSEIANDDVRGRLASVTSFTRNIGVLLSFVVGGMVDYKYVPCIYIVFPILFGITFIFLPNSPRYYLQRAQQQKAENALKFYKCYKGSDQHEIDAFHKEFERLKATANEPKSKEKTRLKDFCKRSALKGLGIGITMMAFSPLTAVNIIMTYGVTTLQKLGTSVDAFTSSIVLGVALIFGSLTSTYLADTFGRRKLNLISLLGAAIGLLGTALYHYLSVNGHDVASFAWIPVVCLCFVIFISTTGILSLTAVCCIENLPSNVRNVAMAMIFFSGNLFQFASLKTYPKLLELVDLYGFLLIYGIGCIVAFTFIFLVLKETAGQSIDDLDAKSNGITKTTLNTVGNSTSSV